jgi:hypothetical protein
MFFRRHWTVPAKAQRAPADPCIFENASHSGRPRRSPNASCHGATTSPVYPCLDLDLDLIFTQRSMQSNRRRTPRVSKPIEAKDWGCVVHSDVGTDDHGGVVAWLRQLISAGGEFWCVTAHSNVSMPMFGHYRCLRCNRVYPVRWKEPMPVVLGTTARISSQMPKESNFGKSGLLAARHWLERIRSRKAAQLPRR